MPHTYCSRIGNIPQENGGPTTRRVLRTVPVAMILLLTLTAAGQTRVAAPVRAGNQPARTASAAQKSAAPAKKGSPDNQWLQDALKNPDVLAAVGHIQERLTNEIQYPPALGQSRILPRLADSAIVYAALPNPGQQVRQALQIFQEELRASAPLQDFMRKNHLDAEEPQLEDAVQKFYEFSQYLGDELVITGGLRAQKPSGVLIAEVRKPGLKAFLEKVTQEMAGKPGDRFRILDPQQLATGDAGNKAPAALVRQDFLLIGLDTASLREFNAQLDNGGSSLLSTSLGKRLSQSYQSGAVSIVGADLQKLIALIPQNPPQTRVMVEKTGLSDVKYAVMESKISGKNTSTQMELMFNGPRRAMASWIAAPASLGALDFMSTRSYLTEAIRLKSPAQIFDDIVELAGPNAFAMLPQMEAQLNINLKQDILSKLGGELAFELQTPPVPQTDPATGRIKPEPPRFKVVLSVLDQPGLQRNLKRLLAALPMQPTERVEDGVTYYSMAMPSATGDAPEFNYFFMDGYLVVASSRELAREAVRIHRSGDSVAQAREVALQGKPPRASALLYQNSGPMLAAMTSQLPPELSALFSRFMGEKGSSPTVALAFADDTALRSTMNSSFGTNAGALLIGAAVAIPNLLHSRASANESAAAATVRTVNTAQITYATSYPRRGYAPNLATLGPGDGSGCANEHISPAHACLLEAGMADAGCTAGNWCEKDGYRFNVHSICQQTNCRSYVVTATPVNENTGAKSFCSTSDAVVRSHQGAPVSEPLTVAACKTWTPVGK